MEATGGIRPSILPIPVVLRSQETTDEYEAEFLHRVNPHSHAIKKRSEKINFAIMRARDILGGIIPPITPRYAAPTIPSGPSKGAAAGAPAHKWTPDRYVDT